MPSQALYILSYKHQLLLRYDSPTGKAAFGSVWISSYPDYLRPQNPLIFHGQKLEMQSVSEHSGTLKVRIPGASLP